MSKIALCLVLALCFMLQASTASLKNEEIYDIADGETNLKHFQRDQLILKVST